MTIVMTTNKRAHRHEILWWDGRRWRNKNRKSNLHHHATKRREGFKRQREALRNEYENEFEYYLWGIVYNAMMEAAA